MKKTVGSPHDLLLDQMKDLHSMESQIGAHLPELAATAADDRLRARLLSHSHETDQQLAVIRELFARHGEEPGHDKCKAIAGLIDGGKAHLASVEDPGTRDLMIIAHCLRVERYEIAAYEISSLIAGQLGLADDAALLLDLLSQEQSAAEGLLALEPAIFETAARQP